MKWYISILQYYYYQLFLSFLDVLLDVKWIACSSEMLLTKNIIQSNIDRSSYQRWYTITTNTNNNIDITDDKLYQLFFIISDILLNIKCVIFTSEMLLTNKYLVLLITLDDWMGIALCNMTVYIYNFDIVVVLDFNIKIDCY